MKEQRPGSGFLKAWRERFWNLVEGIWITIVGTWKSTRVVEENSRSYLDFGQGKSEEKRQQQRRQTKWKKTQVGMRPRLDDPREY